MSQAHVASPGPHENSHSYSRPDAGWIEGGTTTIPPSAFTSTTSKPSSGQLQAVVSSLAGGLAPSTVGTIVQHLRQVLNGAVADRIIPENPAARLRLPRPDDEPLVVPTPKQVQTITDAIDPRYRALVVVGAGLGLRQGEAFALTRSSVDFLRKRVHVRAQIIRPDNGPPRPEDTTKTGMARTVPLPDVVAAELAQHLEHDDTAHPAGLLFTSVRG